MQKVILVVIYDENLWSKDEICSRSKSHIRYDELTNYQKKKQIIGRREKYNKM